MTTITTLLSGGECVGIGARAAGLTHIEGFEIDDKIAGVARVNGFNVHTADVLQLDPTTLQVPDVLHASPVCKNASVANQSAELNEDGTKESSFDIAMGEKVAQFIDAMTPKVFTLENVYAYRNFKAFKIICAALDRNGYMRDYDNLNAADYGVPQTRRRLILRAVRGALLPMLPQPERWVGWYEAIEDLIPGLPESQFAAWQLKRLPEGLFETSLVERHGAFNLHEDKPLTTAKANEPVWTVRASQRSLEMATGFIVDCQNGGDTNGQRGVTLPQGDEPMFTVTSGKDGRQPVRAWLADGDGNRSRQPTLLDDNEPSMTVQAWHGRRPIQMPRALLVNSANKTGASVRDEAEPSFTIETFKKSAYPRAWLIESKNMQEWGDSKRRDDEPAMTVNTDHKPSHSPKAWLSQGRVVRMTPRALARFMSLPDDYILPDSSKLACTVIGNGVCPKLYQKIVSGLTQAL